MPQELPTAKGMKPGFVPQPHQVRFANKMEATGAQVAAQGAGTGKTLSAVYSFDRLRKRGRASKMVVVTPAGLKKNFTDSVEKFSTYSTQILAPKGDKSGVYFDRVDPNKDVTVVSYEMFRADPAGVMRSTGADMLVFDEYHKAQPLSSGVLTPTGWRTMGDIKVGDLVVDPANGGATRVTGVHPQGKVPVFRVTFGDGASTLCCDDHLWEVQDLARKGRGRPPRVLPLKEIRKDYIYKGGVKKYRIRMTAPVEFEPQHLPLHPYVVGALIGDGCLTRDVPGLAGFDQELLDRFESLLPEGVKLTTSDNRNYRLSGGKRGRTNPVTTALHELGLMGKYSYEKRIPEKYLYGALPDRIELLRGIMDTDGSPHEKRRARLVTTSHALALDVQQLVWSLGGKAYIYPRGKGYAFGGSKEQTNRENWEVTCVLSSDLNPFWLPRKASKYQPLQRDLVRVISSIEPAGEEDAQCITVESPERLYLTDCCIVTHNTREPGGASYRAGMSVRPMVKSFIGLTGSSVNNDPEDLLPLINLAAGKEVMSPKEFNSKYKRRYARTRGFFGGEVYLSGLVGTGDLKKKLSPYVDYISTDELGNKMPRRSVEEVNIPMSKEQQDYYNFAMKKLDPVTAWKIKNNLPVDQKQAAHVFQMIQQARQAANSIGPFVRDLPLDQAAERSPKVKQMLDDVVEHLRTTPDGQVVVYSNLIKGGVDVVSAGLKARGIDHGVFVGKGREIGGQKITDQLRNEGVTDYMAGKKRVIVLSPAGAEGLDLKNSTMFASLDGHFNPERTRQAEARARRLGGLAHRPENRREVQVRRYFSTFEPPGFFGRMFGAKPQATTDQWVDQVARQKHKLNQQMLSVFRQSPAGTPPGTRPVVAPHTKYLRRWKSPNGEWRYEYPREQPL